MTFDQNVNRLNYAFSLAVAPTNSFELVKYMTLYIYCSLYCSLALSFRIS